MSDDEVVRQIIASVKALNDQLLNAARQGIEVDLGLYHAGTLEERAPGIDAHSASQIQVKSAIRRLA